MQEAEDGVWLWKEGFTILAVLIGAALTWASTLYFHYRTEQADRQRMLTVLFGDILNVRQHYSLAAGELPEIISSDQDILALKMSRYGSLAFTGRDLSHLGFLSDQDIMGLMQLALVVRNTDFAVEALLERIEGLRKAGEPFRVETRLVRNRMKYAKNVALNLLNAVSGRNTRLQKLMPSNL